MATLVLYSLFLRVYQFIRVKTKCAGFIQQTFKHRGLNEDEVIEHGIVTGAGPMLEWISEGAQVISY